MANARAAPPATTRLPSRVKQTHCRLKDKSANCSSGLPPGTGPYKVIANLAAMGYHEDSKRMQVESLHPNVTLDVAQANTGFELLVKEPLELTPTADDEQLRVLREEVDPQRDIIGRG